MNYVEYLKDLDEMIDKGLVSINQDEDMIESRFGDMIDCSGVDCIVCILHKYRDYTEGCDKHHNYIMNYCKDNHLHPEWFL